MGGGLRNNGTVVLHKGEISFNLTTCKNRFGGGGILNVGNLIIAGGEISGNAAATYGGGLSNIKLCSIENCVFEDNNVYGTDKTNKNGGGAIYIYGNVSEQNEVVIDGATVFKNNSAPLGNGGAVNISYSALPRLKIGRDVIFDGNTASAACLITNIADVKLHNTHVFTRKFSNSFEYGYNNYDIAYTEGKIFTIKNKVKFIPNCTTGPKELNIPVKHGCKLKYFEPICGCSKFEGWYKDKELTDKWNFNLPVTSNMTLYAKWGKQKREIPIRSGKNNLRVANKNRRKKSYTKKR
jgi:uncharacterized repeat protein (TIGR02543 family)